MLVMSFSVVAKMGRRKPDLRNSYLDPGWYRVVSNWFYAASSYSSESVSGWASTVLEKATLLVRLTFAVVVDLVSANEAEASFLFEALMEQYCLPR